MGSTIIPTLRYKDASKMIDWLCTSFGFEKHLLVEDDQGGITHAQLTLGTGMIMLGSDRDDAVGALQSFPEKLGGTSQSPYIVVGDVDAIADRSRAAGAEIVMEPEDQDYGGRAFSCRDPEGHLWHFGSYDPWAEQS